MVSMREPLHHFLLVYDNEKQELVEQRQFEDAVEASEAYAELEARYRKGKFLIDDGKVEVVLIGADSIETIMKTHGNYFPPAPTHRYLSGL